MKLGLDEIIEVRLGSELIEKIYDGTEVVYEENPTPPTPPTPTHDYEKDYLTFRITSSGDVVWDDPQFNHNILYSKDSGTTWSFMGETLSADTGDVILFKGDNPLYYVSNSDLGRFKGTTAGFTVEGNILSMIDSDPDHFGISGVVTIGDYALNGIFQSCTTLTSAEHLVLPSGTPLTRSCYAYLFQGCSSLSIAPALPATTLAQACYERMFGDCTSLSAAPTLPATTLAISCYSNLFRGCTSLTTAPALPATTMVNLCYNGMFSGCTSLSAAPELPATTLAQSCYASMFKGCTGLTTGPVLPAATLVTSCYSGMCSGCSSLSAITCLATNPVTGTTYMRNWLSGVAAAGTFTKDANTSSASYASGANGIPSGWSVVDYTPPTPPTPPTPTGGTYTPMEYIYEPNSFGYTQSSYIDTGIAHTASTMTVEIEYYGCGGNSDRMVGYQEGDDICLGDGHDFRVFGYMDGTFDYENDRSTFGNINTGYHHLTIGDNFCYDEANHTYLYSGTTQGVVPSQGCHILVDVSWNYPKSVIIRDGNTVLFNGVAALSNGEYGLWDTVDDSLFTNNNISISGSATAPQ